MRTTKKIKDLHAKRMKVKKLLDMRYWELDKEHKELWKLQERLEMEKRQAVSDRAYDLVSKLCDQVEAMDCRVCRIMAKYSRWHKIIDYWTQLYDKADLRARPWQKWM